MISVTGPGFSRTGWSTSLTGQVILAGLIIIVAALLFCNFLLTPELSLKKQLTSQIQQIQNGLIQMQEANKKFQKVNKEQFLQDRETVLAELLPAQLKHADLLRCLTKAIQKNWLI